MLLETILKTKFFNPNLSDDFVHRSRLADKLDSGERCILSLVSAAAGYGKRRLRQTPVTAKACWSVAAFYFAPPPLPGYPLISVRHILVGDH